MTALKPCPFCGAKPEYKTESDATHPFITRVWIRCPQCRQSSVCSDWYNGDLGTMEASWDTRTEGDKKCNECGGIDIHTNKCVFHGQR